MGEEFPKSTGTCKYCGNLRIIQTVGDISQAEADEIASKECDCDEAKKMRKRESKIKKANDWADGYFETNPNIVPLFKEAFRSVANHETEKIAIKEGEWTHNIYLDSDGYLCRKSSKKVEEEDSFL